MGERADEAAFAVARVAGARGGRTVRPTLVVAAAIAAVAGIGWASRGSADDRQPRVTASPTSAPVTSRVIPLPRAEVLVLTSPSHDGETVQGMTIRVVGYVLAGPTAVSIVLDDGTSRRDLAAVVARPRDGDPAASRRSWFRASIPLDAPPTTTLWLEVSAYAPTGEPMAVVRRSLGPVSRSSAAAGSAILGGRRADREQGTDGLLGGIVFDAAVGD